MRADTDKIWNVLTSHNVITAREISERTGISPSQIAQLRIGYRKVNSMRFDHAARLTELYDQLFDR